MEEQAEDAILFLENARKTVNALEAAKEERQKLSQTELKLKKRLASEQQAVEDEISTTIKKRKEEISASFDKEISLSQDSLRKLRNKKEQAVNAGKKERIESETAQLREEVRSVTEELKVLLKKNRVPSMAKHRWFYVIFMPQNAWEVTVDISLAILFLFILPYLLFMALPTKNPIVLSILHFVFFAVIGGAVMLVNSKVKYKYLEVLKQALSMRRILENDKKKIHLISSSISKDPNEEHYDLQDYNYNIAKMEAKIEEIGKKKQEALQTFEAVTKNVIADEIREGSRKKIEGLKEDIELNNDKLTKSKERVSALGIELTDKYEGRLGRENLNREALEQILMQLRSGSATNITDAISNYRSSRA